MSHNEAISSPPPTHTPSIAAIKRHWTTIDRRQRVANGFEVILAPARWIVPHAIEFLDVGARGKVAASATDHYDTQRLGITDLVEYAREPLPHRNADGIQLARRVERDGGDATVDRDVDLARHLRQSSFAPEACVTCAQRLISLVRNLAN